LRHYAKVVERFTANYVFALGIARFLSCAHWAGVIENKHSTDSNIESARLHEHST
jgi:hypothetical protein